MAFNVFEAKPQSTRPPFKAPPRAKRPQSLRSQLKFQAKRPSGTSKSYEKEPVIPQPSSRPWLETSLPPSSTVQRKIRRTKPPLIDVPIPSPELSPILRASTSPHVQTLQGTSSKEPMDMSASPSRHSSVRLTDTPAYRALSSPAPSYHSRPTISCTSDLDVVLEEEELESLPDIDDLTTSMIDLRLMIADWQAGGGGEESCDENMETAVSSSYISSDDDEGDPYMRFRSKGGEEKSPDWSTIFDRCRIDENGGEEGVWLETRSL